MKIIQIVLLLVLGLNSSIYSQPEINLEIKYNGDTSKIKLNYADHKKIDTPLKLNLKENNLRITFIGFPDNTLIKILPEVGNESYSSDGELLFYPKNVPNFIVTFSNGIMHADKKDLAIGSMMKIVIKAVSKNWLIETGLTKLENKPVEPINAPQPTFGIPFYDAKYLLDANSDRNTSLNILLYYLHLEKLEDTIKILTQDFGIDKIRLKNIYNYIQKKQAIGSKQSTGESLISSIFSSAPNAIGNYDVTNIADGIARFLVTRVKEELSIAFFQHFKDKLDEAPTSDLQYLFPVTYDILHSMDQEIYNWDNYITSLREGFDKDISNLVPNLERFEANASILNNFRKVTANQVSAQLAIYMAKGFVNHVHAGQLLDDFNADEYIKPTEEEKADSNVIWTTFNLRNSVKTLQLISSSVRTRAPGEYWINDSELNELLHNDNLFDYYSLLLSLEARKKEIKFRKNPGKTIPVEFVELQKLISDVNQLKPVVNGFTVKIKDFRSSYAKMKTAIDNAKTDSIKAKISYVDVYPFIQSSIGILKYTNTALLKLKVSDQIPKMKELLLNSDTIIDMLSKAGELGMDVSLKRYSAAIADITYLINRTRKLIDIDNSKKSKVTRDQLLAIADSLSKQLPDNKSAIELSKAIVKYKKDISDGNVQSHNITVVNNNDLKKISEGLVKYGTFMASVVKAENSEEVKKVIQNFALPTGSSRIKRSSAFNVSINAYPGLFTGYEQIKGVDSSWSKSNHKFNSFGISAPIGVSTSFGQRNFFWIPGNKNWSYSLFVSVIDLGAIAAFRFQNDTVESVPTIKLKDIISPGVFLSIGIPKCPLSFNMGVQVGPNLRKITSSTDKPQLVNDYSSNIYVRYSFSLCVDIPVLNLVNRTDRK
jgi:hypothetical protein